MFDFLTNSSFYLWLTLGLFVAYFAGFANVSRGAFFHTTTGVLVTLGANIGAIIIAVYVAYAISIIGGVAALIAFWLMGGYGSSRYVEQYGAI
jgi:hypothetical protein